MIKKYEDIINLPHHTSKKHKPMPIINRAAQFCPFMALTGYDAAIKYTELYTEEKVMLSDDTINNINRCLAMLEQSSEKNIKIRVTYFIKHTKKEGGVYAEKAGYFHKIDAYESILYFSDGTKIPFCDIKEIKIDSSI